MFAIREIYKPLTNCHEWTFKILPPPSPSLPLPPRRPLCRDIRDSEQNGPETAEDRKLVGDWRETFFICRVGVWG